MNDETIKRGPGRPPNPRPEVRAEMRDDDPRARAAKRAAEVRQNQPNGSLEEPTDRFAIDASVIPEGWSYEWKRDTFFNKEDPAYQVQLRRMGWEPVPASRHPEMMPVGSSDPNIRRDGMVLMERPAELTEEVRALERKRAREQVKSKEEQLAGAAPGQFERSNKDQPLVKVKKTYEPVPIPQ